MTTTEHAVANDGPTETVLSGEKGARRWTSRAVLTRMFVAVTVLAVLVLGLVNFLGARSIFSETIESELASLAADRGEAIRNELDRAKSEVSAVARDSSIAAATRELTGTFLELDSSSVSLRPDQEQALEQFYASGVEDAGASVGSEVPAASELVPRGESARYLQYHYIVENPFERDERQDLVDAEDGSSYSAAHRTYHPMLTERARAMGVADLLLIGRDTDDSIVYSVSKQIDFGTSLLVGPYSGTALAEAVTHQLASVPVGEAILVDFDPYVPNGGLPTMFVAAAVRDQSEIVGSVVVALPRNLLDDVTTFGGQWTEASEGGSGEVYLVGSDLLMRSVSRFWLESPEDYLESLSAAGYADEVSDRIVAYGSTVLAQPVETEAAATALEGGTFIGNDTNYLDTKTFAGAEPLQMADVDWVVVAEVSAAQANSFLVDFGWSILLLALITIPVAAVAAYFMARYLTQPVVPLTTASESIAAGHVDVQVPDLGRNEYGDLGNRINTISAEIRESDAQRAERNREILQVLFAALPPRLVDDARAAIEDGTIASTADFGDLLDTCTVIAVSVSGYFDLSSTDMESTVDVSSEFARSVEKLASGAGVERVRSTPDEYVFTAGLRADGFATENAAQFVADLRVLLEELQEDTSRTGEYRVGLSAGRVASGVIRGTELSFGIWGPPVRRALSLVAAASAYQVLVDQSVADELGDEWEIEPDHVINRQGDELDTFSLHPSGRQ